MTMIGIVCGSLGFGKLIAACLLAALPAQVSTSQGDTVDGEVTRFGDDSLTLRVAGDDREIAYDDLVSLVPRDVEEKTGPTYRVTLLSGSRIQAVDLALEGDTLTVEPRRQDPLKIPVRQVKSIRFRSAAPGTDPQWLGLLEREGRGDLLAIRRDGDRMDPYRGVIQSIGDGKVGFDIDGDTVGAPIEKLEGVVFGGNQVVREDANIKVIDIYGSQWAASGLAASTDDEPLKIRLGPSITHELPLSHVLQIRWSSGLQLLAETDPVESSFRPYFEAKPGPGFTSDWFSAERSGDSDLILYGNSTVEYRAASDFVTFSGSVNRERSVRKAGEVTVTILVDDQVRWREGLGENTPLGFELPLENARRIRIEVSSGKDGDLGDTVRILRPRLLK